jgi:hypothetical protein
MSGTFQLNSELFPKDPLSKRWTRQRVATASTGEGIFIDFWQLEMRFGTLDTVGESDFFMGKFLEGGLHNAVLPHPEDGSLQSFTGVAIANYSFSFGDIDRDGFAQNPTLTLASVPVARL